jgi:hypothetical protein
MTTRQLSALVRVLRAEGVTRYATPDLTLELGPAPQPSAVKQVKQSSGATEGVDVTFAENGDAPQQEESITDLGQWLNNRYATYRRTVGQ